MTFSGEGIPIRTHSSNSPFANDVHSQSSFLPSWSSSVQFLLDLYDEASNLPETFQKFSETTFYYIKLFAFSVLMIIFFLIIRKYLASQRESSLRKEMKSYTKKQISSKYE